MRDFSFDDTREPTTENELILEAQIPSVFDAQKMWCYMSMESDGYPRFLRSKALNITLASAVLRSRAANKSLRIFRNGTTPLEVTGITCTVKGSWQGTFFDSKNYSSAERLDIFEPAAPEERNLRPLSILGSILSTEQATVVGDDARSFLSR